MTRLLYLLYFLLINIAYAEDVHEAAPTAYTEPAGMTSVIVFFALFFGSIVGYFVWLWYRNKKAREDH
jgi:hypothetical protein